MRHTYASNWPTADADHGYTADQLEHSNVGLSIYDTSIPTSCQRAGAFTPLSHADQTADKTGHVKRLIFGTHLPDAAGQTALQLPRLHQIRFSNVS